MTRKVKFFVGRANPTYRLNDTNDNFAYMQYDGRYRMSNVGLSWDVLVAAVRELSGRGFGLSGDTPRPYIIRPLSGLPKRVRGIYVGPLGPSEIQRLYGEVEQTGLTEVEKTKIQRIADTYTIVNEGLSEKNRI